MDELEILKKLKEADNDEILRIVQEYKKADLKKTKLQELLSNCAIDLWQKFRQELEPLGIEIPQIVVLSKAEQSISDLLYEEVLKCIARTEKRRNGNGNNAELETEIQIETDEMVKTVFVVGGERYTAREAIDHWNISYKRGKAADAVKKYFLHNRIIFSVE